ncbi:unnamed protein product [Sphagnum balticum]
MNVLIWTFINVDLQLSTWAQPQQPQLIHIERNGPQVPLVKVEPRGTQPIQPVAVQAIQPMVVQPIQPLPGLPPLLMTANVSAAPWSQPAAPVVLSSSTINPIAIAPPWQQAVTLSLPSSTAACTVQTVHPPAPYNSQQTAAIDACVKVCCADRPGGCVCVHDRGNCAACDAVVYNGVGCLKIRCTTIEQCTALPLSIGQTVAMLVPLPQPSTTPPPTTMPVSTFFGSVQPVYV